jgi:uncharacterized membrane protein YoaK (UPF0700 family)
MWQAALLCGIAGYVDALGYLKLGSVFAANMTGNTVLLAIVLAHGEWARAAAYGLTLAAFFAGALSASVLKRILPHGAWLPLLVQAVLLIVASLWPLGADKELVLLAFGMGLQGAAVTRLAGTNLYTVVITATICRLASGIVDEIWPTVPGAAAPSGSAPWLIFVVAWLFYGIGAALEVLLFDGRYLPLVVPAALLVLYAGWLALHSTAGLTR